MTDKPKPSFDDLLNMDVSLMKTQYVRLVARHNAGERLTVQEFKTLQYLNDQIKAREAAGAEKTETTSSQDTPKTLSNLMAVVRYLQGKGFKVKKSAVYNHAAKGLIPRTKDGTYLTSAIDTYAAAAKLTRLDGAPTTQAASEIDKINQDSAREELRRRTAQADLLEQKVSILKASFIPKAVHEQEITARAARLWADFQNFVHADLPAVIPLVHGDPVYTPDMIDFILARAAQWFARYDSPDEFVVRQAEIDAVNAILDDTGRNEDEDGLAARQEAAID